MLNNESFLIIVENRVYMKNKSIIFLIIAFFLIFAGFDSSQQYLSSIFYTRNFEMISFIALSILYITSIPANFIAPFFCRKFGLKKSLFFSSLAYPVFIISIVLRSEIMLYISSVIIAFAGSMLWISHGTYLTRSTTNKNRGFYSGLSFSFLVIGSAITIFFMSFFVEKVGYNVIYFILFLIACLGSISLLFISDIDTVEKHALHPIKLIKKKSMLLFAPFIFSSYFIVGSIISRIPIRITDLFGLGYVGKIAPIFGVTICIFSFLVGKLSDKYGFNRFAYISVLSSIAGFFLILVSHSVLMFSIGIFLIGLAHSSFLGLNYPILHSLFEKEVDSAMALKGVFCCMGIATPLVLSMFVGFQVIVITGIVLSVISLLSIKHLFSIEKINHKY